MYRQLAIIHYVGETEGGRNAREDICTSEFVGSFFIHEKQPFIVTSVQRLVDDDLTRWMCVNASQHVGVKTGYFFSNTSIARFFYIFFKNHRQLAVGCISHFLD